MRRTIGGRPVVHRGGDEIVVKRGAGDRSSLVEEGGSIHARPTELTSWFFSLFAFPRSLREAPTVGEKKKGSCSYPGKVSLSSRPRIIHATSCLPYLVVLVLVAAHPLTWPPIPGWTGSLPRGYPVARHPRQSCVAGDGTGRYWVLERQWVVRVFQALLSGEPHHRRGLTLEGGGAS